MFVSGSWRNRLQCFWNASAIDEEGVIGYHAATVAPPKTQPSAAALLPSMKIFFPTAFARFTRIPSGHASLASA